MRITYRTKEESNREQQENFLKLSPVERIYSFINLMYHLKDFPTKKEKKNNFIITIHAKDSLGK